MQNLQNSNKKLKTPAKNSLHCYLKYAFCNFLETSKQGVLHTKGFVCAKWWNVFINNAHPDNKTKSSFIHIYLVPKYTAILSEYAEHSAAEVDENNAKGNIKKNSRGHKSGDYGVFHFVKKLRMFTKSLHILIQASVLEMFCVY